MEPQHWFLEPFLHVALSGTIDTMRTKHTKFYIYIWVHKYPPTYHFRTIQHFCVFSTTPITICNKQLLHKITNQTIVNKYEHLEFDIKIKQHFISAGRQFPKLQKGEGMDSADLQGGHQVCKSFLASTGFPFWNGNMSKSIDGRQQLAGLCQNSCTRTIKIAKM